MSTPLSTLHPDLRDLVGKLIAERYRVDALVGVGGMGAVFKAHHLGLARDVAVKVLHPALSQDPEFSARFDREARSASRLQHPNCLQVTDYGTTEHGMKFMVMQLLEGHELTRLLGRPVTSLRAIEFALQIARGLGHAHGQGIVHRDVKPENVFVTSDAEGHEVLKLVDFGIAKIISGGGDQHMTRAGLVFGTPAYMSPEQATAGEIDERADLYSLGIMLYEMLAGRPPFQADDPVALVRMQVTAEPPPLPGEVPAALAELVGRLLAKHREERVASAKELCDQLEAIDASLRCSLHVPAAPTMQIPAPSGAILAEVGSRVSAVMRRPVRGQPLSRWAAGAALLLLGFATAWSFLRGDADRPEDAVEARTPEPGDPEPGTIGTKLAELLRLAGPSKSEIAEVDGALAAGNLEEADKRLALLRDRFPKDAVLFWRQGRILAQRKSKQAQALASYARALEGDRSLLSDPVFMAELDPLLRAHGVRDEALNLALHQMGEHGHGFLLELVNNEKKPLSYDDRHRALEELSGDAAAMAGVNLRLNRALDLLQATQSLTPCAAYESALKAINAHPDPYYVTRIERAPVPATNARDPADAAICASVGLLRAQVLAAVATAPPSAEVSQTKEDPRGDGAAVKGGAGESSESPGGPGRAPGAKSTRSARPAASGCDRFSGIFRKRCWR